MKTRSGIFRGKFIVRVMLFGLILMVVPALWSFSPQPIRADGGGGFPTSTFIYVFPTSTSIIFPTATLFPTVNPPDDSSQVITAPTESPTAMVAPTPTSQPSRRPTLAYLCWPMGLALIVVAVIGATFVFRRVLT
jgi:hypothetical protein